MLFALLSLFISLGASALRISNICSLWTLSSQSLGTLVVAEVVVETV